jgi:DNA-binding PadR family transcriptional regulator
MQDPTFWILVSLLPGELHGYAIIQETKKLSSDRVRLGAGTLYTALDRLQAEGLIAESKERIEQGRARKYYRLGKKGRDAIGAEITRRESMARIAKARFKLAGAQ